jgi:ubiquinone biosynthesis protein
MKRLFHTVARGFLVFTHLVPIYVSYFWLWFRSRHLGWRVSRATWKKAHERHADRFYRLAVRMRGAFIKLGQILSMRVDLLPKEWTTRLSALQDKVEPTDWSVVEKHLEAELGAHPDEVFESITHESVNAASFGQVHRARLKDGRDVALKVKYPDIDLKLSIDLGNVRRAVPFFNIFVPKVKLAVIYEEVRRAFVTELDYRQEAEYTRMIGENLADFPGITIPEVVEEYTTGSIICTTFFEGHKVTDRHEIERQGADVHEIMTRIIAAYTHMIFVDGVFQSDPHPGNILFRVEEGTLRLCILDFGQVKVFPEEFQARMVKTSFAYLVRDVDGFLAGMVDLGFVTAAEAQMARPIVVEFFERYYDLTPDQVKRLDFAKIRDDVKGTLDQISGIHIPTDVVLYGRTLAMLNGLCTSLDSSVNGLILAKPFIMEALMKMQMKLAAAEAQSVAAAQ